MLSDAAIMTYGLDEWVVRKFPGQRIVRLCKSEDSWRRTIRIRYAPADRLCGIQWLGEEHNPGCRPRFG